MTSKDKQIKVKIICPNCNEDISYYFKKGYQQARAETIKEVGKMIDEKINRLHHSMFPDFKQGYDQALDEVKEELKLNSQQVVDIDTNIKKVAYKGEFDIKEKLSPEFDDLIKTLQFPDKFYNILDKVIKREVQETKEKINKIIEEWYLEHRKKGDGIGKLYEELKLKIGGIV